MASRDDLALLQQTMPTGTEGVEALEKFMREGNAEVRKLLQDECDVLLECRYCRNIYRSVINFISHKRDVCRASHVAVMMTNGAVDDEGRRETATKNRLETNMVPIGDTQMSLSKFASMSISDDEVDRECGDYFPFLGLPDELISHTFSFMGMKDRMRARVNRRLDKIELESKYHVERLNIKELPIDYEVEPSERPVQVIFFREGKSYSSDVIKRITKNTSIGYLFISLSGSSEFHREVYNLMKYFHVKDMGLYFKNPQMEQEVLTDSFVLDLTKKCENLGIVGKITLEALHKVYEIIIGRSARLFAFGTKLSRETCIEFLRLIGIVYRDGQFFSNRDIEIFKEEDDEDINIDWYFWNTSIFDGNLEIYFKLDDESDTPDFGYVTLGFHKTRESLEEAKNEEGWAKVDIAPE